MNYTPHAVRYEIYSKHNWISGAVTWRWRLRARNGRVIASGEGFKTQRHCMESVDLVQQSIGCPIVHVPK